MKCAKCGAELKIGCIYCSVCGKEAQIVSDDTLLEEELLQELLKEENQKKTVQTDGKKKQKRKKKNYKPLIISLTCLAVLLIAAVALILAIRHKNSNSYDYQIQEAEAAAADKNYTKALEYYRRAINLKQEDIDARLSMAELYILMEEDKSAISILHEVISFDPDSKEAYQQLIDLYDAQKDYQAILKLKEEAKTEELLGLFEIYETEPPEYSIDPGTYGEYIEIEITAQKGCVIYYTEDGSNPAEGGKEYKEPILMEEAGTLHLKAVACNEYGIYSETAEGTFTVKFQKPKVAKAVPDSGSFTEPTTIELIGTEGSRIYYTWDGSDPTVDSQEYTGPIEVPEGNHILSVILVDKYGMVSDVLKCNYRYLP